MGKGSSEDSWGYREASRWREACTEARVRGECRQTGWGEVRSQAKLRVLRRLCLRTSRREAVQQEHCELSAGGQEKGLGS